MPNQAASPVGASPTKAPAPGTDKPVATASGSTGAATTPAPKSGEAPKSNASAPAPAKTATPAPPAANPTPATKPGAPPSSAAGSPPPTTKPSAPAQAAAAPTPAPGTKPGAPPPTKPAAQATPSAGSPGDPSAAASTTQPTPGAKLAQATPPTRTGKTDAGAPPSATKSPPPPDDSPVEIHAELLARPDSGSPGPDFAAVPRRERTSPRPESDPLPPPPTAAIPGGPLNIPGSKVDLESRRVGRFLDEGGSTLLGRVLDADTGTGVADAQIEAWMGTRSIHAETDGEGRFRFEGLAPGSRITIWITATTKYVQERIDLAVPGGSGGNFNTNFKLLPRSANAGRSGGIGVFLNRRGGKTVITGLDAFGPAERAGVQIGDTIVAVGNRQTADLGPGAIEYLLRGAIGGDVEITVAGKSGAPRKLSLKRTGR